MLSSSNHFYTHMYFIKIYYIISYYTISCYILLYCIILYCIIILYDITNLRLILDSFARSSNTRENELKAEWADFFVTRLWFSMMIIRVNLCRSMHYFDKSSQHQSISKHIKAHIQTITAQHTTWDGIKWYGSIFSLQLTACLVV